MNILILTIYYPDTLSSNINQTKAIHYLAKYLVKDNRVAVLHNRISNSPVLRMLKHEESQIGYLSNFERMDGVEVIRNNVINFIPHYTVLTKKSIKQSVQNSINILEKNEFRPDVIVAHFCWQQRKIIDALEKYYCVPIIPVFHNIDVKHEEYCRKISSRYYYAGARSKRIKDVMLRNGYLEKNIFIVKSGFPPFNQREINNKEINSKKSGYKFVFAGNLIKIKRIDDVINAMSLIKDKYDFTFEIIGDGHEKEHLVSLCHEKKINERIFFSGRLTRDETIQRMKDADCYIMVSSPETFGISYIEAMACKCFVIASKGEGIDGVITSGFNGLLAIPRNKESIVSCLEDFFTMDITKRCNIVKNGYETSQNYSEAATAKDYYEAICGFDNER